MKVSEAIKKLELIKEIEGDIDLGVMNKGVYHPVEDMRPMDTEEGDKVYDHWHRSRFVGVLYAR